MERPKRARSRLTALHPFTHRLELRHRPARDWQRPLVHGRDQRIHAAFDPETMLTMGHGRPALTKAAS